MRLVSALLLPALLSLPLPARAVLQDPVAVMPFKNLNEDAKLDWLRLGVSETMVADLRKSGAVKVVERDQIDRAMAEIALQGAKGKTEESSAAQVGKMVGAKTILVGSFQAFGDEIRFVARFVLVETGVVQDAVKVTGPMRTILSLQDQIVGRLLGEKKAQVVAARPKRKDTEKTVQAYRLYAMSLATASDADRVGYLQKSVEIDPEFTYAVDDLLALQERMKGYAREADRAATEKARAEAALVFGEGKPEERAQKALQLLTTHLTSRHYRALIRDARRVMELDLPPIGGMVNVREAASFYLFTAYNTLKQQDLALQTGEAHLKAFPAGMYSQGLQMQMQMIIRDRLDQPKRERELAKDFEENEKDRREAEENKHSTPVRFASVDLRRCTALQRANQFKRAAAECRAVAAKHKGDPDPNIHSFANIARYYEILSLSGMGDFPGAREAAARVATEEPDYFREQYIQSQVDSWPVD